MKALIYERPETLRYSDAPDPVAGEGEYLVRVEASGICGSDMHAYLGQDDLRPAPLILGHEAAGTIVGGRRNGTRVTINPLVTCGVCAPCASGLTNLCDDGQVISMPPRDGAFAQLVALPRGNLVSVPENLSLRQAALAEPIACGWHAVRQSRRIVPRGRNALVIGGGPIGLGAALSACAQGIEDVKILEPNPLRAAYLHDSCARTVLTKDDLPKTPTFDIVIDAVGYAATRTLACAQVKAGGVIGHIGLAEGNGGLDIRHMTLKEITFIGTYSYTAQDFRDTVRAMGDGRLGPLDWIEERPLSDGAQAFADIRAGKVAAPKIILRPQNW